MHPTQLASQFRRFYRSSVGEYLRSLRIRRAMEELARTDKPIAQIALDVGFSDQSHLTRAFGRQLRTTPATYRRAHRTRD